jgi:hypothetical protein
MSNLIAEWFISRCDMPPLKPGLFYSLKVLVNGGLTRTTIDIARR